MVDKIKYNGVMDWILNILQLYKQVFMNIQTCFYFNLKLFCIKNYTKKTQTDILSNLMCQLICFKMCLDFCIYSDSQTLMKLLAVNI